MDNKFFLLIFFGNLAFDLSLKKNGPERLFKSLFLLMIQEQGMWGGSLKEFSTTVHIIHGNKFSKTSSK